MIASYYVALSETNENRFLGINISIGASSYSGEGVNFADVYKTVL